MVWCAGRFGSSNLIADRFQRAAEGGSGQLSDEEEAVSQGVPLAPRRRLRGWVNYLHDASGQLNPKLSEILHRIQSRVVRLCVYFPFEHSV